MPTTTAIAFDLEPGERLIWSGVPRQGLVLRASDAFVIPFSLLWAGFAIVWETTVLVGGAPLFFALWGIPFVLIGLYITVGRFFVDARRRQSTAYGLTSDRIIIASGVRSTNLTSLSLRTLTDVTLDQRSDGSGTITFGPRGLFAARPSLATWPLPSAGTALEMISDAKRVYSMIQEAQRGDARSSA